jgi:GNAT superfamily N-acetyltransferase
VVIRRAVVADAPSIAGVHVRSWKAAFPGLVPQAYLDALVPEDRLPMWRAVLGTTSWPRLGTFVVVDATDAAAVRGFATVGPSRDDDADPGEVGEVYTIYLDPSAWGTGVGAELLDAGQAEMRLAAYRRATLWTLGTNERAKRFYERRGWKADGSTKLHDWGTFTATDVRYAIELD